MNKISPKLIQSLDAWVDSQLDPIIEKLDTSISRAESGKNRARKALIDSCQVFTMNIGDPELDEIEVYARIIDAPTPTGETENQWRVECVKCDGEEVTLNSTQMDAVYEILNEPKNIRA